MTNEERMRNIGNIRNITIKGKKKRRKKALQPWGAIGANRPWVPDAIQ
jgi:hypothetical protein